ncbi:hypothetical protein LX15_002545 [Streptoalloteichus tenebrarius]|uniref:Uncharacterized protein n=1 Tax=Streptoalloteichus tenebrarius (strain ATCC 17920 / DSM 40477 / JCM 4838 / CBS 697.72 / NBRC 16177 / NCIMB 11028 / NRRL B-12390 / A12253. 1 / ISP 5477) TaxID=1933 RepID=A0ABT1HTM5_STRSD|nr:hypothetical protein [Streptoalloteichus tenebrarius]
MCWRRRVLEAAGLTEIGSRENVVSIVRCVPWATPAALGLAGTGWTGLSLLVGAVVLALTALVVRSLLLHLRAGE